MFKRKKKSRTDIQTSETLVSIQNTIKGYSHYTDKRGRTETDKLLRTYLYNNLTELYDLYSKVHHQLMQAQILSAWQASNQIMTSIKELRTFLTQDVYRHSTFFEAKDISTIIEISVVYILESEIILSINSLQKLSSTIYENLINVDMLDIEKNILRFQKNMNEVSVAIRDRAELIASFELVGV